MRSVRVPSPETIAHELRFPEGPAFAPDGSLWCVEFHGGSLRCWRGGESTQSATGGEPNGAAVDRAGRVWFCDAGLCAIRRFDPRTDALETMANQIDGRPLRRPNDLAFDSAGNLVFTCPGDSRREPTGEVCCLSPDGEVSRVAGELYFPNGLAFTPDGGELVVAETYRQRLWRGEWDAARRLWRNPHVWATGLDGAPGPDGMAFADDGSLFVAVYGAGIIARVDHRGSTVERLATGGRCPTNCALDPSGVLGLVVTEAERGELLSMPDIRVGPALFHRTDEKA
ncbi:MAG TPA: SMP-30/gluconolactonase/LRE family protein [Thermoguttaceae bacterium]|nr:SMP-30/gluconolactonase/LRE family protein [Thermoguttaceae bacterium]